MASTKPRITRLISDEYGLCIDWESTLFGFTMGREYGDAIIFVGDPPFVQAGIDTLKMLGFRLVPAEATNEVEIVLDVTYAPGFESLGITSAVDEATAWVQEANQILQEARPRVQKAREQKGGE
ncbi:MAG: hypothetical protein KatS3mg053_3863 [Candidatus Roseilinea sp.]|nr:MAG: hypothetical protein KatS3mg053_3863 [Candidatus Roseilinea sp.]